MKQLFVSLNSFYHLWLFGTGHPWPSNPAFIRRQEALKAKDDKKNLRHQNEFQPLVFFQHFTPKD